MGGDVTEGPRVRLTHGAGVLGGVDRRLRRMSAFGYKRTYNGQLANVRFTPVSGHSEAQERLGLKKRSLDVRFTPKSGHSPDIRALLLSGTLCTDGGPNFSANHQCGAG